MQVSRNEGHFRKNSITAQGLVIKASIFGRVMLIPLSTRKVKLILNINLLLWKLGVKRWVFVEKDHKT